MSASMKRKFGVALLLSMCVCWGTFAQGPKKDPSRKAVQDSTKVKDASSSKEEANRNVMLNAASANGPREIQIGLPSADVNVLENGVPVTYEPCGAVENFRNRH